MKLLLDTHTFIWFVENDSNLPQRLVDKIEDTENEIFISIASLWEMAIKISLGKLEMTANIEWVINSIKQNGFHILPISPAHLVYLVSLPFHHRDPFDRVLITQSFVENIQIISKDGLFDDYHVIGFGSYFPFINSSITVSVVIFSASARKLSAIR